jgi:hypothetical protein
MGMGRNHQVHVHHLFTTRNDFLTAPLCWEHHQGSTGFHGAGQRKFERMYKLTELDLLAITLEMLED